MKETMDKETDSNAIYHVSQPKIMKTTRLRLWFLEISLIFVKMKIQRSLLLGFVFFSFFFFAMVRVRGQTTNPGTLTLLTMITLFLKYDVCNFLCKHLLVYLNCYQNMTRKREKSYSQLLEFSCTKTQRNIVCFTKATAASYGFFPLPLLTGFISIDCGIPDGHNYTDNTNIFYVSDSQYIDTGINNGIASNYINNTIPIPDLTARSFPVGGRNCYTLKPVVTNRKYLLRATFMYGNYD